MAEPSTSVDAIILTIFSQVIAPCGRGDVNCINRKVDDCERSCAIVKDKQEAPPEGRN